MCLLKPRSGRATLHLNLGSEGGQREVQHGDELVVLAARTLLRLCALYDGGDGGGCAVDAGAASGTYRSTVVA